MTPEQVDRVFGSGRLKMATGEHVEVFREAVAPGERRRYTKRFLATPDGDFGPWTEREWRILARLIGHGIRCIPDVVQFDGGAMGGPRLVQTFDAGVTVDQWATLLPVARDGAVRRHVFEDCAHWWALAHHCLAALNEIHALKLVHLDVKGDNICIPYGPADFDPEASGLRLRPAFQRLALIDFAFSLVSGESLSTPLPIGWQKDYDYQSPRLLRALEAGRNGDLEPTRELDWRCDLYSLAAMLKRYLPAEERARAGNGEAGWTPERYDDARALIFRLRDSHDCDLPNWRPHRQLLDYTDARLDQSDLAASLDRGWMLARDVVPVGAATPITPVTPVTRIAPSVRCADRVTVTTRVVAPTAVTAVSAPVRPPRGRAWGAKALGATLVALIALAAPPYIGDPVTPFADRMRDALADPHSTSRPAPSDSPAIGQGTPASASSQPGEPAPASSPPHGPDRNATTASDADSTNADLSAAAEITPEPAAIAAAPAQKEAPDEPRPAQDRVASASAATEKPDSAAIPPRVARARTGTDAASERTAPRAMPPPTAGAPAKPRAAVVRAPATKRSSVAASPSAAKPLRVPATAHAAASTRSSARQAPARVAPSDAPAASIQSAAASPTASESPGAEASLPAADSRGLPAEQPLAPPSQAPERTAATESASIANEAGRASEPTVVSRAGGVEATPGDPRSARTKLADAPRGASKPPPREDWRSQLANFLDLFRGRDGPAAPIEERSVEAASAPRQRPSTSTPARPTPFAAAQAAPAQPAVPQASSGAAQPAAAVPGAQASAPDLPVPSGPPAAVVTAPVAPANSAPPAGVAAPSVEPRWLTTPAPATVPSPRTADARAPPRMSAIPPPGAFVPAPTAAPPRPRPWDDSRDVLVAQAKRILADTIPRVAARAQPDVARVLWSAAAATHPSQAQAVVNAADAQWDAESVFVPTSSMSPAYARRLHDDARQALASGRSVSEAIAIELQAFGANPRDPDIVGYLAYLHLRATPVQPETARQLALHAIVVSGSRRAARSDDWSTLAVASALAGRETDSIRAFMAEIALTSNVDRSCRTALSAYASFGDPLRIPVQAMLYRVHSHGRAYANPSCAWPPHWNTAMRWSRAP